jgi:hypothetical protein
MPFPDLDFYLRVYRKTDATAGTSEVSGEKPLNGAYAIYFDKPLTECYACYSRYWMGIFLCDECYRQRKIEQHRKEEFEKVAIFFN